MFIILLVRSESFSILLLRVFGVWYYTFVTLNASLIVYYANECGKQKKEATVDHNAQREKGATNGFISLVLLFPVYGRFFSSSHSQINLTVSNAMNIIRVCVTIIRIYDSKRLIF